MVLGIRIKLFVSSDIFVEIRIEIQPILELLLHLFHLLGFFVKLVNRVNFVSYRLILRGQPLSFQRCHALVHFIFSPSCSLTVI